jgi:hypothetical protein
MIEQIFAYFTIDMIYLWLNLGVLPFWLVLIFFPESRICSIFITSIIPIFIISLVYCYVIYTIYQNDYDFLANFNLYLGIDSLKNLFESSSFLILFWAHFLGINLFCGSWIIRDSQKYNITKILIFFPILITYFTGPLGLLVYWIMKIFFAKKISLYE